MTNQPTNQPTNRLTGPLGEGERTTNQERESFKLAYLSLSVGWLVGRSLSRGQLTGIARGGAG